jgi:RND superfamily putative drug exporter
MTSGQGETRRTRSPRGSPLGWLGRRIARHPWYALILWIAVVVVCIIPAANVGKVINNNFTNPLPSSDESVRAQNAYGQAFPTMQADPSSAIILLESSNIVGPVGKNATLALTAALSRDGQLKNVSSIESVYSAYSAYLVGQVELGWGFLGPALNATPSLPQSVNDTAEALWEPVAAYVHNWESIVVNQTAGTPNSSADWPAYQETLSGFPSGSTPALVLGYFYNGETGAAGFNESVFTGGCLSHQNVSSCATEAAYTALPGVLSTLFPSSEALPVAQLVLADLNLGNWSEPQARQVVAATVLGAEVGISPAWLLTIWEAFPSTTPPSTPAVVAWVDAQVVQKPIGQFPLPIPSPLYSSFVNPSGSATLVVVSFNVDDSYTVNGTSVAYADVSEIDHVASQVIGQTPAYAPINYYVTGGAPLDSATNYLATSSIGLLLILTIIVLLVIMIFYFRAPAAPALAFGMIGISLVVSLAAIFVIGTFVTTFNSEIESILLVFLMSIGTDYSVFLLARYREELVKGASSQDAIETTVRWAGQSIATSGAAVMVVAVALTLSNISFLTQLGICILVAVAFALAVNLTVLPSILALVGPRIFWPNSGDRFSRYAMRRNASIRENRDYIARAGRTATRHPLAVVALILMLSVPVVVVAVEVPISYDITNIGLPASNPAWQGFQHLENDFGASYSSTSYSLVTFSAPVVSSGGPNAQEFRDIAALAATMGATSGVASVSSLVGSGGAPLDTWLNYSTLRPAIRIALNETLSSYVGVDGRTVLFNVATNMSGYSASAISVIDSLQQRVQSYAAGHSEVTATYFGGAAPTTQDIRSLVNQATENMLIGAAIGLFVLMLLILGSAFVPLLALAVIGLSILWSWAGTYFVVGILEGEVLIFLLPLILLILVLGLGMDYNVLLLTRVKEERSLGDRGVTAIRDAVTHAGGVITAAAVILGGAFLLLGFTSPLGLIAALGLGIGFAVLLQAFVVQLFFTPAVLTVGKDSIWKGWQRSK